MALLIQVQVKYLCFHSSGCSRKILAVAVRGTLQHRGHQRHLHGPSSTHQKNSQKQGLYILASLQQVVNLTNNPVLAQIKRIRSGLSRKWRVAASLSRTNFSKWLKIELSSSTMAEEKLVLCELFFDFRLVFLRQQLKIISLGLCMNCPGRGSSTAVEQNQEVVGSNSARSRSFFFFFYLFLLSYTSGVSIIRSLSRFISKCVLRKQKNDAQLRFLGPSSDWVKNNLRGHTRPFQFKLVLMLPLFRLHRISPRAVIRLARCLSEESRIQTHEPEFPMIGHILCH